jgi:hypothetical protein
VLGARGSQESGFLLFDSAQPLKSSTEGVVVMMCGLLNCRRVLLHGCMVVL